MNTPVLFLIFNRADVTKRVLNSIRAARPPVLFVAADGPRRHYPSDTEKCAETRALIGQVDWPCSVRTLFRDKNLGCRVAVSSAIDWFFENVQEGIILEDDCLPHPDFFRFCEVLLEKYRDNPAVMHISGDNFQQGIQRGEASYYFSRIAHIWGWASWRRAWNHYNVDMVDYPEFIQSRRPFFLDRRLEKYWLSHFRRNYKGANSWDYQWVYTVMKGGGYCIMPNVNLISNIGFGDQATHAVHSNDWVADIPTQALGNLTHPASLIFNDEADRFTINAFPPTPLRARVLAKLKRMKQQFRVSLSNP